MFATPDWRCSLESSRMPIVSLIPGRNVTSAASVTTVGEAFRPSWTTVAAQKLAVIAASGAAIGSVRAALLVASAIAPTRSPMPAAAAASRQPPPSTGVSAAPAIPYAASSSGQGRSSGLRLDVCERGERRVRVEPPLEHVLDEVVNAGDRVEVDRGGTYAEGVTCAGAAAIRARPRRASASRRPGRSSARAIGRAPGRGPRGRRSGSRPRGRHARTGSGTRRPSSTSRVPSPSVDLHGPLRVTASSWSWSASAAAASGRRRRARRSGSPRCTVTTHAICSGSWKEWSTTRLPRVVEPVSSASAAAICVPFAGKKSTPATAVHIAIM